MGGNLSIATNAQGLNPIKTDELNIILKQFQPTPKILFLSEHWLKESNGFLLQNFDEFNLAPCHLRPYCKRGGVCMLLHESLPFNEITYLSRFNFHTVFECCAVHIELLCNQRAIVTCVYRPPHFNKFRFILFFL